MHEGDPTGQGQGRFTLTTPRVNTKLPTDVNEKLAASVHDASRQAIVTLFTKVVLTFPQQ